MSACDADVAIDRGIGVKGKGIQAREEFGLIGTLVVVCPLDSELRLLDFLVVLQCQFASLRERDAAGCFLGQYLSKLKIGYADEEGKRYFYAFHLCLFDFKE